MYVLNAPHSLPPLIVTSQRNDGKHWVSGRTLEEALNVFTQTTHAAIEAEGKTPAVWEGMGVWCGRCSFVC